MRTKLDAANEYDQLADDSEKIAAAYRLILNAQPELGDTVKQFLADARLFRERAQEIRDRAERRVVWTATGEPAAAVQ